MRTFVIAILLSTLSLLAPAQNKAAKPSSEQPTYSESTSYTPRKIVYPQAKSAKKNPKSVSLPNPIASEEMAQTGVALVEIPVFVLDQTNKPVNDLPKDAFHLYIDNQEQAIERVNIKDASNFILALDTSGSTTSKLRDLQHFASELVLSLAPQNKIKILAFDQKVTLISDFTNDQEVLQKALKKLKGGEGTSLYDTFESILRNHTSATDQPVIILLVTDGVDTTSKKADYESSLKLAENTNAIVFPWYLDTYDSVTKPTINPSNGILGNILQGVILNGQNTTQRKRDLQTDYERGKAYLLDLALLSGGAVIKINSLNEVKKANVDGISEVFKPTYYLSFSVPVKLGADNRLRLKVRVNRPNLIVNTFGSRIVAVSK